MEVFGEDVVVVIDRFHVAKLYGGGLDNLRKKEIARLKTELAEEEHKKLKWGDVVTAQECKRFGGRGVRSFGTVI